MTDDQLVARQIEAEEAIAAHLFDEAEVPEAEAAELGRLLLALVFSRLSPEEYAALHGAGLGQARSAIHGRRDGT